MHTEEYGRLALVLAVALIVVLLAAQGLAAVTAPAGGTTSTGEVLGQTGFAYLGGLRTFAAAVMWNRIEPVFHEYYAGVPLLKQTYMIPTLRVVVALDPQFAQAYYISSYMVFESSPTQGIALAREGVAKNPKSGLLHANLAQLLFIRDKQANRAEILEQIRAGSAPDAAWLDEGQKYEGFAMMSQAAAGLGQKAEAARLQLTLEEIRKHGGDVGDHDHDGDGKQDH
jgi:hypothetical protein